MVSKETLEGFLDAFKRHHLEDVMSYFAENCVFYMPRGAPPRGDRYVGWEEIRAGLSKRFHGIPDVHYGDDSHWGCGDFGVSGWTLASTTTQGEYIEVRGVDLPEFHDRKFRRKDSFWKILDELQICLLLAAAACCLALPHRMEEL